VSMEDNARHKHDIRYAQRTSHSSDDSGLRLCPNGGRGIRQPATLEKMPDSDGVNYLLAKLKDVPRRNGLPLQVA